MTGIERLREFAEGINPDIDVCGVTKMSYDREHKEEVRARLRDFLANIADQIERELSDERDRWESDLYEAQVEWNRVTGVCLEMERHCLYNEDTVVRDVARWARELRHAMKSDASDERDAQNPSCHDPAEMADVSSEVAKVTLDPAEDVSMSVYDLLPEDEREAIAWVSEHGGLDQVKIDYVVYEGFSGLVDRVAARLGVSVERLDDQDAEPIVMSALDRRLMPEGMEWPMVDGKPVVIGERMRSCGIDDCKVVGIDPGNSRLILASDNIEEGKATYFADFAEDCHRPAPKVLDADGAEIRVGDRLYDTDTGCGRTVRAVNDNGTVEFEGYENRGWFVRFLTHQRPVLDADGVPIKVGDTVYFTDGREQECNTVVYAEYDYKDEPYVQLGRLNDVGYPTYTNCSCIDPSQLTHTKPEPPDSWERIEEDARKYVFDYWGCFDISCDDCPAEVDGERPSERFCTDSFCTDSCGYAQQIDLVRRCKELARKENNNE